MSHPQFVQDVLDQLGSTGLRGAICYCGGRNLTYTRPEVKHPLYSEPHDGIFQFIPNIKKKSVILIAVELSDTYFVGLYVNRELYGESSSGVYCDQLQKIVEETYDDYIKEEQQGFIEI